LEERIERLRRLADPCRICPHECKVNRREKPGICRVGYSPVVASFGPHFGEEAPLVGHGGSGTIFFAGCNLLCVFCQNYDISHGARGIEMVPERLADVMCALEHSGCHNVNFVTPTHFAAPLAEAILIARERGLTVPTVYNSSGYDKVETLRELEGLIDIYMPDVKFASSEAASALTTAAEYGEVARAAVREMHRQVGDLVIRDGLAVRGLLVRHLVLPRGLAGTREVVDFLVREVSPDTYINVMGQYRPCHEARRVPEIARRPTHEEIEEAFDIARRAGLRLDE